MTPRDRSADRQRYFESAMAELVRDSRFEAFIELVRQYREQAIDSLSNSSDIVKSERATLACIGEIAAYKSIISVYDDFKARPVEMPQGDEAA